jgi:Zn-dependent protease
MTGVIFLISIIFLSLLFRLWMVMSGRRPIRFSIGSPRDPGDLWPDVESHLATRYTRSAMRTTKGDDWEERVIGGEKPLIIQFQRIDTGKPYSRAFWMRAALGTMPENKPWMWEMAMVEAQSAGGSRLTAAFGGNVSLLALFGLLPLYFRMRALCRRTAAVEGGSRGGLSHSNASAPRSRARSGFVLSPELRNDLMTSLIACASFIAIWGWEGGLLLIPMVLLHEYGHVLAYRMTGKTGNRMMLVPFFGGIAIASEPHKSEFERAFCAIMGPAICLPLSAVLTAIAYFNPDGTIGWWATYGAFICASMNAANLLPLLPLDGGHSTESLARSVAPQIAGKALAVLTVGGAIILARAGYTDWAFLIAMWGFPSIMRTMSGIDRPLPPMTKQSGTIIALFHAGTFAIHAALAWYVWTYLYG